MPLRLSDIPAEGLTLEYQHSPELLAPLEEGVRLPNPPEVRLTITPEGDRYLIQGSVSALVIVECARCLAPINLWVDAPCSVDAVPLSRAAGEDATGALGRGDLDVTFYSGDVLDVDGLVRDQLMLQLPMHPLCRDTCLGLCPSCGVNRNEQACACASSDAPDPRFDILRTVATSPGKRLSSKPNE